MIRVIATVHVKPGRVNEFLGILKANVPLVRKEKGCVEYVATVDVGSGLPPQSLDENRVTVIENWDSLEALGDHLSTSHMVAYQEKVKDMVEGVSLRVLREA